MVTRSIWFLHLFLHLLATEKQHLLQNTHSKVWSLQRQLSTGEASQRICLVFLIYPEGARLYEHTVSTFCASCYIYLWEKHNGALCVNVSSSSEAQPDGFFFFFAMLTAHKDSKNKVLKKKRTTPDVDVWKEGEDKHVRGKKETKWVHTDSKIHWKSYCQRDLAMLTTDRLNLCK